MKIIRDYQRKLLNDCYTAWHSSKTIKNVVAVMPTGAGKTVTGATLIREFNVPAAIIAHRQELVAQISCAIADQGIYHRIIAPKKVIQHVIKQHIKQFGKSFHHPNAPVAVAGVDTLIRRSEELKQWINQVRLWSIDECHHVLRDNKWGKAVALFIHALGIGWTATPIRCDRKSLGRSKSGVFDALVQGPTMRDLINMGNLCEYRIFGIEPSYIMDESDISESTGEFKPDALRKKAHASKIVGDIVQTYLQRTPGKLGITFTVDVELAKETAEAFRHHGVPAEALSGETPDDIRTFQMERFQRGEIKELVNVDLFGEGLDVPGVEVVSDGRRTQSFGRYAQVFGRMMRPSPGKEYGIYLDHVGNCIQHGLPDRNRLWSLDDEERGKRSKAADDAIPLKICTACRQPYEAIHKACPHCGHVEEPLSRAAPQHVDGDLTEYGPELLAKLRGEIIVNAQTMDKRPQSPAEYAIKRNMEIRAETLNELQTCIAYWAGIERDEGLTDSQSYRKFYYRYGIDVLSAQTLETPKMRTLIEQIRQEWI
ncbi:putative helicase [Sinorhizobium phage HMSP1-Susan]|nr:putative helicase [Sinorhizobium phage HMSP1-Susan]